jgi:uncharacterized membrane protein YeaQ/YmgE (transglycosylase-associated protein family)
MVFIHGLLPDTDAQMGAMANIIVGIIGAVIGGFLISLFGMSVNTFSIAGLVVAILGAIVLLFLVGMVQRA